MRPFRSHHPFAVLAVAAMASCSAADLIPATRHIISGDSIEGLPPGVTFRAIWGGASMNTSGELVLHATLQGEGITQSNQFVIAVGRNGSFRAVARGHDTPPGFPESVIFVEPSYTPFEQWQINDSGGVFFGGHMAGPAINSLNDDAYWYGRPGNYGMALRESDQAPGTAPGVTFRSFNGAAMSVGGNVLFRGHLTGPGVTGANDSGLWYGEPGSYQLLARMGDPAPGIPGATYSLVVQEPTIAANGLVAFKGRAVDTVTREATWYGLPGALAVAGVSGQQAPGLPDGTTFTFGNDYPTINESGQVVFRRGYTGTVQGSGFFLADESGTRPLILEGQAAVNRPGVTFTQLWSGPTTGERPLTLNNRGQSAFFSFLSPGGPFSNFALGVADESGASVVARLGDQAPGLQEGVRFNGFGEMTLNDLGQIIFSARVSGREDYGLWAYDGSIVLLLVRAGDTIQVASGDVRTVAGLDDALNGSMRSFTPHTFSNSGDLTVQVTFTDGTFGVFTFHVPGPGGCLVFAMLAVAGVRRRP